MTESFELNVCLHQGSALSYTLLFNTVFDVVIEAQSRKELERKFEKWSYAHESSRMRISKD
jgi:hypothetical protein